MAEPKCPSCNLSGIGYFGYADSDTVSKVTNAPWFTVIYCTNCGHVYGVIAKEVFVPGAMSGGLR
jgi:hypothetical protein